jgi:hypothetical protein
MKNFKQTLLKSKNKVFGLLYGLFIDLQRNYHIHRIQFVSGLTVERFAYAEFYLNDRKDIRTANNFDELKRMVGYFSKHHGFKRIQTDLLLRAWASRKPIKFLNQGNKLMVVTYWHF